MKLSAISLILSALVWAPSAFAGVLVLENSASKVSGKVISKGGKMEIEGRSTDLVTVGAGLRKRFGLFSVYVGELLVSDKTKYVCESDKALDSLKDLSGLAVRLQFLRAIDKSDLQTAFSEGFENNEIDANNEAIQNFLEVVSAGGNVPNGAVLAFTGEKLGDGSEAVTYENAKGQAVTVKGGAGFVRSIFALWLGNPGSDDGLKGLQQKLTNCEI